jgi:hypothetical protein
MCAKERVRQERKREKEFVCVCVCLKERERGDRLENRADRIKDRERERDMTASVLYYYRFLVRCDQAYLNQTISKYSR